MERYSLRFSSRALQVSSLVLDTVSPNLERFIIEPTEKKVYFFFDEAVKVSTWDASQVTFQNVEDRKSVV